MVVLFLFAAVWAIFWLTQIIDLMARRPSDFTGPQDKVAWAIIISLVPILGCLAYFIAKPLSVSSPASLERELRNLRRASAQATPGHL
jgi:hypothetical protein